MTLPESRVALPVALAALGAGYYIFTEGQRPPAGDVHAEERWQEHMSGARFALVFGAGAGLLLWWANRHETRHELPRRESLS